MIATRRVALEATLARSEATEHRRQRTLVLLRQWAAMVDHSSLAEVAVPLVAAAWRAIPEAVAWEAPVDLQLAPKVEAEAEAATSVVVVVEVTARCLPAAVVVAAVLAMPFPAQPT